jgi:hypothetical protein
MEDLSNTKLPGSIPVTNGIQTEPVLPSRFGVFIAKNQDGTSGADIPGLTTAAPAPVLAPTPQAQDHQQANTEAVAQVVAALNKTPEVPEGMQSVVDALKGASVEGGQ